ncbi:uncharacterized protein LOC127285387 [Leptopilina boulardi]|uniref:uncharacterized protein LOC127285387 n=1 Tax=Leptopilina boulardi TaxID=63433 RepID=UPI0021F593E3|nr:uncharacterized protein LOC127285387 [Leptopilina boulardi]
MCHSEKQWIQSLPVVMMGLRNNVLQSGASPAEYIYGTTFRIPGQFVLPEDFSPNPQFFLEEFREHMRLIRPVPVEHHDKRKIFVHKNLESCTHVFLKAAFTKKSLECPYSGPHRVVNRTSERVYEIEINGVKKQVSVENLKPAFFVRDDADVALEPVIKTTCNIPVNSTSHVLVTANPETVLKVKPVLRTYVNKKKKVTFNLP